MNTQTQGDGEAGLASPFAGVFASWMLPLRVEQNADGSFEVWSKRDETPGSTSNFVVATCQFEDEAQFIAAAPALAASHAALVAALEECLYSADSIFSPRLEPVEHIKTVARKALSDARKLTQV